MAQVTGTPFDDVMTPTVGQFTRPDGTVVPRPENRTTHQADQVFGLAGDDRIEGGGGGDRLLGGLGSDRLFGQGGQDHIFGDGGDDLLYGGDRAGFPALSLAPALVP